MRTGNGKRVRKVTELAMGHSVGDGGLMKLNYEYGELQTNGTVDATKNAGNIAKQTVNFAGLANPFIQTYKYDSLDRITEAIEKVNGTQSWKQTFGYDVYGNRNSFYQIIGSQVLTINNLSLPTVEASTNRFSASQGYGYDKNGNITTDPANSGRTFIFNGDNKQKEVKNSSNVTVGTYLYDGQGKRVKKITDLETTIFVYDGLGKLVAEYSTATPPQNPTVNYTATDQLGSPRVLTNSFGEVVSRRDFMPFGEELYSDGTYRKTADKYSTTGQDAVRKRFTGYEKDIETGLDFAEARYYNDQHGRFTAVDPLLASGKSANPQTFNRYVYALNRPLVLTDPTGLQAGSTLAEVVDEVLIKIQSIPAYITERASYLLSGATNISTLDQMQFERAQEQIRALNGDVDATRRVVGNKGPTVDAVLQQTADSVALANDISNAAITVNSLLLLAPIPRGATPVTTNRGLSVSSTNPLINPVASTESTTGTGQTQAVTHRFNHIFGNANHNLGSLVRQFGSQENTFNAVQQAANQALGNGSLVVGNNGILPTGNSGNIINVGGTQVRLIGGRVVDGTVQISSFSRQGLQ